MTTTSSIDLKSGSRRGYLTRQDGRYAADVRGPLYVDARPRIAVSRDAVQSLGARNTSNAAAGLAKQKQMSAQPKARVNPTLASDFLP
jgi:hypothetical protein